MNRAVRALQQLAWWYVTCRHQGCSRRVW